jgi:hypothetical protein
VIARKTTYPDLVLVACILAPLKNHLINPQSESGAYVDLSPEIFLSIFDCLNYFIKCRSEKWMRNPKATDSVSDLAE